MRVFVSYHTRDLDFAKAVAERLASVRLDLRIYLAPLRNIGGGYWVARLGQELAESDAVLLLLGRRIGTWQELEYYEALRLHRARGTPRIIPVLLEDDAPGLPFLQQLHCIRACPQSPAELTDAILAALEAVTLDTAEGPAWRHTNPYRGLLSMGTSEAAYFFGREALTREVLNGIRTRPSRIQMLVGNSGVGKSSVMQAGVIASLRSRIWPGQADRAWPSDLADSPAWLPVVITPGESPLRSLARGFARTWIDDPAEREAQALGWRRNLENGSDLAALAGAARERLAEQIEAPRPPRVLLYVDQAEELYTRAAPAEAEAFSRLVSAAVESPEIIVAASIRADYYGRLQEDAPLFAACDRVDVPPLSREALEDVIRRPVTLLGARFETPGIVPMMADAAVREPGSLPLLSDMLAQAWEDMRGDEAADGALRFPLGVESVSRPLVERAERFLDTRPHDLDALRRLLTLRLAHVPKEGGEAMRRRAHRRECREDEWRLAVELSGRDWRLLATGEEDGAPTVEVAHEALLRIWPRLSAWLDEEREFLIWKGRLEGTRREWVAAPGSRKDDALLMGLALETARRWMEERGADLAEEEATFIRRSVGHEDRRREEVVRRARELAAERARSGRRLAWIAGLAAAMAAVFLVLGGVAAWQWREADAARIAEAEARRASDLNLIVAKRNVDLATQRQELLALALAREESARVAAEEAGAKAEAEGRRTLAALREAEMATAAEAVARREAEAAQRRIEEELRRTLIERARFLASAARGLHAEGWADGALEVATAAFPADASQLWAEIDAASDATIELVRALPSPPGAVELEGHAYFVKSAGFSPDGTRIVSSSDDGTARIWDVVTGTSLLVLSDHVGIVWDAAFSPDGRRIATAADDGIVRIWDAETGSLLQLLRGHRGAVVSVRYARETGTLLSGSTDGTVRLWDSVDGRAVASLAICHAGCRARLSPDGKLIAMPHGTKQARLWDIAAGRERLVLEGHDGEVTLAVFSPDGARILTASRDRTARLWDAATGAELKTFAGHRDQVWAVAFSPDGARILTGSSDHTVRMWDVATGMTLRVFRGHRDFVYSVDVSPDGTRIVSASYYGRGPILWGATSLAELVHAARERVATVQALGVREQCAFYLRTEGC